MANAKLAYQQFLRDHRRATAGRRWRHGRAVQRPLWASTGTKNPAYSDVLYVDDADRPRLREHDARGHDRRVPRPRHRARTVDADVDGARQALGRRRGRGRRSTRSPASSRSTASSRSRRRSTRCSGRSRSGWVRGGARRCLSPTPRTRCAPGCASAGRPSRPLFMIFGATGDLAQRKLLPAIYNLAQRGLLPAQLRAGRLRPHRDGRRPYRRFARAAIERTRARRSTSAYWPAFAQIVPLPGGGFDDDDGVPRARRAAGRIDDGHGTEGNRVFYLSTPSSFFPVIVHRMGAAKLEPARRGCPGRDREAVRPRPGSRRASWPTTVHRSFEERRSTGSTTTWARRPSRTSSRCGSRTRSSSRSGTTATSTTCRSRWPSRSASSTAAAFYEETGVVRDIVQNHLLQVLVAGGDGAAGGLRGRGGARREGEAAAGASRPMSVRERGARPVRAPATSPATRCDGYREEPNVPADSRPPTYIAAKLEIDNWRWAGTPFYIRTGKRLAKRVTEVAVQFKRPPHLPFSRERVGAPGGQLAGAADPAGRGHLAALRRQGAVADPLDPQRQHGLPVRLVVPDRRARGVRDADPRCDPGRRHPVHAPGRASSDRGRSAIRCSSSGASASRRSTRRAPGARRARTSCWPATAGAGGGRDRRAAGSSWRMSSTALARAARSRTGDRPGDDAQPGHLVPGRRLPSIAPASCSRASAAAGRCARSC